MLGAWGVVGVRVVWWIQLPDWREGKGMSHRGLCLTSVTRATRRFTAARSSPSPKSTVIRPLGRQDSLSSSLQFSLRYAPLRWSRRMIASLCPMRRLVMSLRSTSDSGSPNGDPRHGRPRSQSSTTLTILTPDIMTPPVGMTVSSSRSSMMSSEMIPTSR